MREAYASREEGKKGPKKGPKMVIFGGPKKGRFLTIFDHFLGLLGTRKTERNFKSACINKTLHSNDFMSPRERHLFYQK